MASGFSEQDYIDFDEILKMVGIDVLEYVQGTKLSVKTALGNKSLLGVHKIVNVPAGITKPVGQYLRNPISFVELFEGYCESRGLIKRRKKDIIFTEDRKRLENYTLIKNLAAHSKNDVEYYLATDKNILSSESPNHFATVMGIEDKSLVAQPAFLIYDPYRRPGFFEYWTPEGTVAPAFNTHIPPEYVRNRVKCLDSDLPEEVDILFSQVAAADKCRRFLEYFLYQCITSRPTVYLILQAKGGEGKSTLKAVLKALVGSQNFATGKKSTLTGNFNSQLANNRVIVFDEIKYGPDEENAMKEIPNGDLSIEAKFKDATRSTKMHAGLVLCNNRPRDNYLSFDSRKFAALEISTKRLETVLPTEKIENMLRKLDEGNRQTYDVEYVTRIYNYLMENGNHAKEFPQGEYRGSKFWKLCHSSMARWQKALIAAITDPDKIITHKVKRDAIKADIKEGKFLYSDLQNAITTRATSTSTVVIRHQDFPGDYSSAMNFLSHFRDLKGRQIFEVDPFGDHSTDDFYVRFLVSPKKVQSYTAEEERRDNAEGEDEEDDGMQLRAPIRMINSEDLTAEQLL